MKFQGREIKHPVRELRKLLRTLLLCTICAAIEKHKIHKVQPYPIDSEFPGEKRIHVIVKAQPRYFSPFLYIGFVICFLQTVWREGLKTAFTDTPGQFAFSRPTITEDDFAILETGKCPARVNGSFKLSPTTGIQEVDYSSPSVQGGKMLAEEIRKYLVKYAEELK